MLPGNTQVGGPARRYRKPRHSSLASAVIALALTFSRLHIGGSYHHQLLRRSRRQLSERYACCLQSLEIECLFGDMNNVEGFNIKKGRIVALQSAFEIEVVALLPAVLNAKDGDRAELRASVVKPAGFHDRVQGSQGTFHRDSPWSKDGARDVHTRRGGSNADADLTCFNQRLVKFDQFGLQLRGSLAGRLHVADQRQVNRAIELHLYGGIEIRLGF